MMEFNLFNVGKSKYSWNIEFFVVKTALYEPGIFKVAWSDTNGWQWDILGYSEFKAWWRVR
jgi:hypothetical protein